MKMRVKPLVVDVIEDDGMWLELSTMTYYDKDNLEPITKSEANLEKEIDDYIADNFSEAHDGVLLSDASGMELAITDIVPMARYFYELGLNTRKENKT